MEKERLDILIVKKGLAPSREKAKALVLSGQVLAGGRVASKVGETFPCETEISIKGNACPYVSRGGLKLEKAMASFQICLTNCVCMDIGASTGGFTDCMLQNGAAKVYSVDVGYGQLAWALRTNPRVVNLERTNVRYLTQEQVPEQVDFISVDVSFISLTLVLPVAYRFLKENGEMACLVKPQFEAGKENVGKKGVVRDPQIHAMVIEKVGDFAAQTGFSVEGLSFSPIKGPEGNIEYLLYLRKNQAGSVLEQVQVQQTVRTAHETL